MKVLEEKDLKVRGIPIKVTIFETKEDFVPRYWVEIPKIGEATKVIIERIKREIAEEARFSPEEIWDPERSKKLIKEFLETAKEKVEKVLLIEDEVIKEILAGYIVIEMLGLGKIDILLEDEDLEEIAINSSKEPIWVYHKKFGWLKTNLYIPSEEEIYYHAQEIGRKVGRQIDILHPLMDAHLPTGDRVNATLFPITTSGNTITIRKFRRSPFTIMDLIDFNTINFDIAAFSWLCIQYELNALIAGGTGSGKTTFMNSILAFIPPNHRVISIEDVRELKLPKFLHWVPMMTRAPNPEGKGEIKMLDLMINSLRMRPDRIVVGEVRRKEEAEVMFEAMRTGHSVYSTLHANTAEHAVKRLTSPPIELHPEVLEALHVIFVLFRHRRIGIRRMLQIAEIVPGEREGVRVNVLTRWRPATDTFSPFSESRRVLPELELFTGMSKKELLEDMEEKKKVLEWMRKYNVRDIDDIGRIVATYYRDKDEILDFVEKDIDPRGNLV